MNSESKFEEDTFLEMLNLSPSQNFDFNGGSDRDLISSQMNPYISVDINAGLNNRQMSNLQHSHIEDQQTSRAAELAIQRSIHFSNQSGSGGFLSSNQFHSKSEDYLSPTNYVNQRQLPVSPSALSSTSLYSDNSSNIPSPYADDLSHAGSEVYTDAVNDNIIYSQDPLHTAYTTPAFLDRFNSNIELGGSVSNTNLNQMNMLNQNSEAALSAPLGFSTNSVSSTGLLYSNEPQNIKHELSGETKLTENNLARYDHNPTENIKSDLVISVQKAPEEIGARTPSLFSNSSHSSINNSPSDSFLNDPKSSLSATKSISSHGSFVADVSHGSNRYLNPDEYQGIRVGRRLSHSSKVRSRSGSNTSRSSDYKNENAFDSDEPSVQLSTREKMLELASPNQSSKRTQKHPSVYACSLCDKRFTRPYNLKSHLRTHTDERPFICSICGKAFARQHDRKRHEDLHTGEKKFQCKGFLKDGTPYGCGRRFARADALRRHFQTEAGKECIRLLVEEEEREKDYVSTEPSLDRKGSKKQHGSKKGLARISLQIQENIPRVAISPPE